MEIFRLLMRVGLTAWGLGFRSLGCRRFRSHLRTCGPGMVLLTVLPATRLLFVLLSFEVTVASGMGDASKDLMVEAPLLRYEDLFRNPTHTRTISCWTLLAVFVVLS